VAWLVSRAAGRARQRGGAGTGRHGHTPRRRLRALGPVVLAFRAIGPIREQGQRGRDQEGVRDQIPLARPHIIGYRLVDFVRDGIAIGTAVFQQIFHRFRLKAYFGEGSTDLRHSARLLVRSLIWTASSGAAELDELAGGRPRAALGLEAAAVEEPGGRVRAVRRGRTR
jgi:hypothetical protein